MANRRKPSGREAERRRKRAKDGYPTGKSARSAAKSGKQASSKKKRRKGMSAGTKVALAICVILLILVFAAIGVLASKMGKLQTEKIDTDNLSISDELELDQTGYLNVALFGLDKRENDIEMGTRSDTIIIASLNRETKEVKLASVYRDTLMQLTDIEPDEDYNIADFHKANSAYAFGEEEEAVAMLNRNLDLDIQKYVTVDFSALVDVINALGGVEIDVMEEEVDYINGYGTEVTANTGVITDYVYNAGTQVLDGVQAVSYCRIRQTLGDDFKRAERQRTVLTKVAEKAQNADIATLNRIIDKVFPKLKTNFSMTEILAYAKDVKKYQLGETIGFPLEKDTMSYGDEGDSVVSVTLESNVIELHKYLFGSSESYTPTSTVKTISDMLIEQTGFSGGDTDTGGYYDTGSSTYDSTAYSDYASGNDTTGYGGADSTWDSTGTGDGADIGDSTSGYDTGGYGTESGDEY